MVFLKTVRLDFRILPSMMVDSSNLDRFKTESLRLMPALSLAQRLKLLCPVQVLFWNVVVPPRMLGAHRWRTTR